MDEIQLAMLLLQLAAVAGIGGVLYQVGGLKEKVRHLEHRILKLET